jgi:hypothetical protein
MKFLITCLVLAACTFLTNCGSEGAPQPPSLDLPQPVQDLRASRKADKVTLDWTQPSQTTDREAAGRHVGETAVCRSIVDTPGQILMSCPQQVERVPARPPASNGQSQAPSVIPVEVTLNLPGELVRDHPLSFAAFAVMVNNHSGRNAGISNSAAVPLAPTLPPPSNLKTEVRSDGVYVSATPAAAQLPDSGGRLQFVYRLDRAPAVPSAPGSQPTAPAKVAEIPASGSLLAIDRGFEWEKSYVYSITPVTRLLAAPGGAALGEVEGEASSAVEVRTRDIFPPAPPVGLQAVFSGNPQQGFIDLTWAPSTEGDLAGYNIYRREEGRPWGRINSDLVKTPVFRDPNVQPGKQYFYAITAVDLRGNESGKSEETHESVSQSQP